MPLCLPHSQSTIFFLCKKEIKMIERKELNAEEKETEQQSKAKKLVWQKKKNRETEQRSRPKPQRDKESEQRTCVRWGESEPASTRQRTRMRLQLISASSSMAVMNDLGGIVTALAASEQHARWLSLTCGWHWHYISQLPRLWHCCWKFIKSETDDELIHQSLIAVHLLQCMCVNRLCVLGWRWHHRRNLVVSHCGEV